jgi:hypothetical protein
MSSRIRALISLFVLTLQFFRSDGVLVMNRWSTSMMPRHETNDSAECPLNERCRRKGLTE